MKITRLLKRGARKMAKDLFGIFNAKPDPKPINSVLQRLTKRAERLNPEQQSQAFVSIGGIDEALRNPDNRIIFGRRGTGKTHLLVL